MALEVAQFICLNDNFGLLVHEPELGATASVDAPDGEAIANEAERRGWPLTHLLLTHHHADHVQGTQALKNRFPHMKVIGAAKDAYRLPPLDRTVGEGDVVEVGEARARVIETPGHTLGHIAYYFADDEILFIGDTLFALGCISRSKPSPVCPAKRRSIAAMNIPRPTPNSPSPSIRRT
jgi:hydroxyacylglutathione hydrolase